MKAKLNLKRERLTELTPDDLLTVNGAQQAITAVGTTCPLLRCLDPGFTDTSCNCCTASASC